MNIAIYTNILTPYRKFFYDLLYDECKKNGDKFNVLLMADTEPNRNWKYEEFKTEYTILLKSTTITKGETYIHFNKNLKKVLEGLQLDILICAGGYLCPGIWKSLQLKKKFGYKIYFWSESHLNEARNYSSLKIKIREFIRKSVYKNFDGFWYAGQLSKQFIELYSRSDADMYFMPNLIEESKYEKVSQLTEAEKQKLRVKYRIEEDKTVFICPARLSYVKGIDKFISIFAKYPEKDRATILVAGDGELKDKIKQKVEELNVDIRLLGFMDQNSVIELYSLSDVFLLPSLSDPNPLTCIEALWTGLPLFLSNHCGNYPEVVREGKNGYVFSYEHEDELLKKLDAIINSNSEWRSEAKEESLKIAKNKYSSIEVVQDTIQYFAKIINS